MKICIFISPCIRVPVSFYGGLERVAYLLAEELGKNNEVYVVAAKGSKFKNCKYIEGIEEGFSTPYENRELVQLQKVKEEIIKLDCDVYDWHIHDLRIIPRELLDKSIYEAHDYKPPIPLIPPKLILARSKAHAEFLEKYFGWEVDYCYNPVDISMFKLKRKKDYFLFLGRIDQVKGAHNFIEIVKSFPEQKFVMAGLDDISRGIDPHFLMKIFKDLPDNCEYIGEVSEEKVDLFARAKALICPYGSYPNGEPYFETFGLTLIESLASGTPVFTLAGHGSPEELIPKNCGVIANSLEELKKALKDFIEGKFSFNPKLLKERAKEFSPNRIANRYFEICKNIKNC